MKANASGVIQVVRFVVGNRDFALDVMAVKEVLRPTNVKVVPGQPNFVTGLVELRGEYVPLIDLRRRFKSQEADLPGKIVVTSANKRLLALMVDSVGEVRRLYRKDLRSPPLDTGLGGVSIVDSIAEMEGEMILILRADALLGEDEWALLPRASDQ